MRNIGYPITGPNGLWFKELWQSLANYSETTADQGHDQNHLKQDDQACLEESTLPRNPVIPKSGGDAQWPIRVYSREVGGSLLKSYY